QDYGNNGNGNSIATIILGGNDRGPRPRTAPLPFNPAVNAGWPPYGMPPNFNPLVMHSNVGNNSNPAFQFGSMPNSSNQFFPEISRSIGASSSNAGVSIQTVRQLIDESHLDLINLLSQHMTTILNPIVADTNAKYDHLARQVERVAQLVDFDENTGNWNLENNEVNNGNMMGMILFELYKEEKMLIKCCMKLGI
ncbi:hypothetical protein PIB30_087652, partial [Stylosanthes scabra]|nr:hypothetical protein [Stylosanthes scabra]